MTVRGLEQTKRAALVISQAQRAQTTPTLRGTRDDLAATLADRGTIEAIAALAADFRRAGLPVVHSHLVPRADWSGFRVNCVAAAGVRRADVQCEGKPGALPDPRVVPEPGDHVVTRRTGLTSFHGTDLDALLHNLKVDTVVVTGVSTNLGVLGTVIEAINRGYEAVVPLDCIAGIGVAQTILTDDLLVVLAALSDRHAVAESIQVLGDASTPTGTGPASAMPVT